MVGGVDEGRKDDDPVEKGDMHPIDDPLRCPTHSSLVSSRGSLSSRSLELASLRSDERLRVRVRDSGCQTKVLVRLPRLPTSLDENRVVSLRRSLGEFVERDALASCREDPRSRSSRESKSAHRHLRDLELSDVVRNCSDGDEDLLLVSGSTDLLLESPQSHGRPVDLRHEQPLEDDLVELRLCSPGEVSVHLDQQQEVWILRDGGLPSGLSVMLVVDVDTHFASSWFFFVEDPLLLSLLLTVVDLKERQVILC